jgi:hypothetical protein
MLPSDVTHDADHAHRHALAAVEEATLDAEPELRYIGMETAGFVAIG